MKDIVNKINENWEYIDDLRSSAKGIELDVPKKAKWLLINTETETISAVTENDLNSFEDDFGDDVTGPEVKKLKIGDSYDADGGINIYIRIKK